MLLMEELHSIDSFLCLFVHPFVLPEFETVRPKLRNRTYMMLNVTYSIAVVPRGSSQGPCAKKTIEAPKTCSAFWEPYSTLTLSAHANSETLKTEYIG